MPAPKNTIHNKLSSPITQLGKETWASFAEYKLTEHVAKVFTSGGFILLSESKNGDFQIRLVLAAAYASTENIAFMLENGEGKVHVSISREISKRIGIEQTSENLSMQSIDAINCSANSCTAQYQAYTIETIIDPFSKPENFKSKGHVIPSIPCSASEASLLEVASRAKLEPAAASIKILSRENARRSKIVSFAVTHGIPHTSLNNIKKFLQSRKT